MAFEFGDVIVREHGDVPYLVLLPATDRIVLISGLEINSEGSAPYINVPAGSLTVMRLKSADGTPIGHIESCPTWRAKPYTKED